MVGGGEGEGLWAIPWVRLSQLIAAAGASCTCSLDAAARVL